MINRALTSTFDLPEDQQFRQGGARQPRTTSAGPSADKMDDYFGMGAMAAGLQYTGEIANQAEKYYQEREKLKQFARTNWLNSKIDVTAPDPSNPAAVRAAQIYQMGLANLNFQGDKLKQSQEMFKGALGQQQKGEYAFGQDVDNIAFAEQTPDQMGTSLAVDPTVRLYADERSRTFETPQDFRKAQQAIGQLQGQTAQDTSARGQVIAQQAQALQAGYNPPAPKEGDGSNSSSLNFVERFVNHKNGGGNWTPSKNYTEAGGDVFLESSDYKGTRLGKVTVTNKDGKEQDLEAVVEKTVRNPKTGETKFIFTNSSIPPYVISGQAANQAIETMSANNSKYPSLDKIQKFLTENNVTVDGVIDESKFLTTRTLQEARRKEQEALDTPTRTKEVLQEVGKTQSGFGLTNPLGIPIGYIGLPRGSKEYETPFGKVAARKYSNGKYEITSPDGKTQEDLSEDDFVRYMRAYGIDIAPSTNQINEVIPDGITPEEWAVMSEEDRNLFRK